MPIDTLFLDVGGVLLTNGWDHVQRKEAADTFHIDWEEFQAKHKEYYDLHETDKLTLDQYLDRVIFWKPRDFTLAQFKDFMYAQSKPYKEMLEWIPKLKKQYNLRIALVSNEGRDLAEYRFKKFNFTSFVDDYFVSCFVYYQKPDPRIYKIALDVTQKPLENTVYIDDRENLIEAAAKLGFQGIAHKSYATTKEKLLALLSKN